MKAIHRFCKIALGLALAWVLSAEKPVSAAEATPNILIILADDLGYGDLSCYGAKDLESPHLDKLATEGVRLTNAYANCPVCSPTRAALLTGRYPDLVGVPGVIRTSPADNWGHLAEDATLIPQVLKKAGYHTGIVGKWHLGLEAPNTPTLRGFDHFHGYLGDMMDDYYHHRRHGINYMRIGEKEIDPKGHATDLFTSWASDFIRERSKADAPWFLYLAYNAPHTPIQPPEEWVAKIKTREAGITDMRAKLVALIEHMDSGIGAVLKSLEESGEAENTLVIFTSDNGGQLSVGANCGDNRGGKQDMYEGGLRVPFIARWPGKIAPGTGLSGAPTLSMDLFPTAAEAAGATFDHAIDGSSILPILLGGPEPGVFSERDLFWVRREGNETWMGESSWAMRRGPWKLVKNRPQEPWEMFHVGDDPLEAEDRWTSKRPPQLREMAAAMRAHIQRGGKIPWQKTSP